MILRSVLASLSIATQVMAQVATSLGPAPATGFGGTTGRISAIACSPSDPNRYFVAGADGGVWRTTDGGINWTPLTDHMPTTSIGALALDPTNENTIYAGTGEANFANHSRYGLGVYKSVDGGESWAQFAADTFGGRCISRIVINPVNPQVLYASVTQAGGFPERAAAKGHPGAAGPRGVFRSADGGQTWTQLAGGLPSQDATDLVMDPTNPSVLYAAIGRIFGATENGIYNSVDSGTTWNKLAGGLPVGPGRISLGIAPTQASRVYALAAAPCDAAGGSGGTLGAYRSDNAGVTWTTIPAGSIQATYGWYLSCVLVSPTDPNTVFMGGLILSRSTSAGASWSTVTPPHVDLHALAFDASGRLLAGDDGGVHRSTNLGSSWMHLNTSLSTVQFYAGLSTHPTDSLIFFGGTQDNGSHRRNAAGQQWTSISGGDGGWTQLDQANPLRIFAESQGTGALYRSVDGGNTVNGAGAGLAGRNCFLPPYLIDPQNPQRMLYGTEKVFVSTNGGTNFAPLSADLTGGGSAAIRALAIAPTDSNYVYAATNDGRIQASTDGGATFTLRLSGVPGWPRTTREITVDPSDPRTVYLATAAFGQPRVRRSRDAGVTWQTLSANLPDIPVNVIGVDVRGPGPVIYAGTDAGLYRTVNDGLSWSKYGMGLPNACIIDLIVEPGRERLAIGTQGRGAWTVSLRTCYPDVDDNGVLNANDFLVFLNAFAAETAAANCDRSSLPPILNANDFQCYLNAFAAGCL